MISFEECQQRAKRVLDFAHRKEILLDGFTGDTNANHVITDTTLADRVSWDQNDDTIEYWPGHRGREYSILDGQGEGWPTQKCVSELWRLQDKILVPAKLEDELGGFQDELAADMWYCYLNEVRGRPSALFNAILEVYEQGGWPCGWLGTYPDGKMIVFDPNPK